MNATDRERAKFERMVHRTMQHFLRAKMKPEVACGMALTCVRAFYRDAAPQQAPPAIGFKREAK